jgi:hypothetical protein
MEDVNPIFTRLAILSNLFGQPIENDQACPDFDRAASARDFVLIPWAYGGKRCIVPSDGHVLGGSQGCFAAQVGAR